MAVDVVSLLDVLAVRKLVPETEVLVDGLRIAFLHLLVHTIRSQMVAGTKDEHVQVLTKQGIGIRLQRILGRDDAGLEVASAIETVTRIGTQVVIEFCGSILLLHQAVLELVK